MFFSRDQWVFFIPGQQRLVQHTREIRPRMSVFSKDGVVLAQCWANAEKMLRKRLQHWPSFGLMRKMLPSKCVLNDPSST